jgi:hypothetical protein
MRHFSTETWAYFARGALPADETIQMQRHLEDCEKCRQTHDMWRAVLEIGLREKDYHPNNGMVRRAKAAYGLHQAWKRPGGKTRARLIFDSFRQPLPGGVRNSMVTTRQLHYKAGSLLIDIEVRKEPQAQEKSLFLVGQILNAEKPDDRVTDFRVLLLHGQRFVAQTISNQLGEFHFELAAGKTWRLFFELEGQEGISIPLPDLTARHSGM